MNKQLKLVAVFVILVVLVAALGFRLSSSTAKPISDSTQNSNTFSVTTSFYPLYFFSSAIGGDKVRVTNITPSGAEPHDYEPTTQDMVTIQNSRVLVLNGNVEPWADKVKANLEGKNIQIIVAGDGLFTQTINEEGTTSPDPHIWLSPKLAKQEVKKISQAFQAVDPQNAEYFRANEKVLNQKLDELDMQYASALAQCQQKDIITSHAAFGYLASSYGLNQVSIAGLSPDEEPSPRQLADVAKFARANNVHYIFFESLVSPKLSETIANEVGAKTLVLDPLEGISDADIQQGKDYFSVMRDNLTNLQMALQCTK